MRRTILLGAALALAAAARGDELGQGKAIFRANCAFCHGAAATGGRGPNLLGPLNHGDRDQDIRKVVTGGVAGSAMPGFDLQEDQLLALVSYVQSLRKGGPPAPPPPGDPAAGKNVYARRGCAGCHEIANQGSAFGPDLTRVGAARSYEYLKESVVNPSADVPEEYQGVSLVTANGRRYSGVRVNEDSFTIQLRLPDQSFQSFDKSRLRQLLYDTKSPMPAYSMGDDDLNNLLAYLSSLRGALEKTAETRKAQGIK